MFWDEFPVINKELIKFEEYLVDCLDSAQPLIEDAINELVQAGGKRVRPALIMLSAHLGDYKQDKVWNVAAAMEILHMATLVHDDIIDEAKLRRGQETIQSQYGKDTAVFTGDYLFSLTFSVLAGQATPKQLQQVSEAVQKICEGEIQQHQNKYNSSISYRDYFRRIRSKTAILFASSCGLGGKLGDLSTFKVRRIARYGRYLGMGFQITDDVLDFTSCEEELGKPKANDFTQGIYTLPIIYILKETDHKERLKNLLENPVNNYELIKEIVNEGGGIEYSLQVAEDYIQKAKKELIRFPSSSYREVLLGLTEKVLNRNF